MNLTGHSAVSIRLSTEESYHDFPSRCVPADAHGILMRIASLEDTLCGKIKAWAESSRRQSKRIKNLADIARLVEAHPELWQRLPAELQAQIQAPE